MTTPMLMTQHPTEELLADYVDNRLDQATRPPVTEHLTSCGECREIVLMATAFQEDEEAAKVTRGSFGARGWAAIGGLAAAAAIAVLVVQPTSLFGPDVNDLVAASQGQKTRSSAGRLAGGFAYSESPRTNRGGPPPTDPGASEPDDELLSDAKLYDIAAKLDPKSADPHVLGLSRLLIAEEVKGVGDAVTDLDRAYGKTKGDKHDSAAIDLAAALIARARWSGHDEDYSRAIDLSNAVLQRQPKSPEALWNRAVALGSLGRKSEALKAWDDYLKVDPDPNSRWAKEAAERKARLQSDF